MVITVPREEIVRMLERAASDVGMGLRTFYEQGMADELDEPTLRDMWLIWGDTLTEEDFAEWEWNQARATVREHTDAAVKQLRSMGYRVTPPTT